MVSVAPRLKEVRERAGLTVRAMAEALGRPSSSYAAYEDPKKFKKPILPFDLAKQIAEVVEGRGVSRAEVMQLAGLQVHETPAANKAAAETLTVKSSVAAGVWREQQEWPLDDWYPLEVGPNPIPGSERFAIRMEGYSMDLTIPPGSDLECVRVAFGALMPVPGDLVIVARQAHDLVETTVKRLDREPDGEWVLRMESSKPEFQDSIRLGKSSRGMVTDEEIRVVGVVLKAHQQHFRRRA